MFRTLVRVFVPMPIRVFVARLRGRHNRPHTFWELKAKRRGQYVLLSIETRGDALAWEITNEQAAKAAMELAKFADGSICVTVPKELLDRLKREVQH